jgi:hypothetical protein
MRKALSALSIAVVLTVPAMQAQATPSLVQAPEPGSLSVSPMTLGPGGRLTVSGSGCPGASTVSLVQGARGESTARPIASLPTRADGSFSGTSRLPSWLGVGTHTVSAVCAGEPVGSATIRVVILGFIELDGAHGPLTISRSAVPAGSRLSIFAQPCAAGAAGAELNGTPLRLATPARVGAVVRTGVTIPRSTPPGLLTLSSRCNDQVTGAATLRILSAGRSPPAANAAGLPLRRFNVLLLVAACLILVMVGYLTVMSVERHRNRTSTPGYFDLPASQRPLR